MVVSTTQRIFEQTINDGIRRGKIPEMSRDSREWFRNKAKAMGKISENKLMKSDESRLVDKPEVGSMYMYIYDPKTKDKLPYYDKFPLIFPIGFAKEGFYGINFHYIPIQLRAKLMDELYTILNNKKFDTTTRLQISYNVLKSVSKNRYFVPCVKRYLYSHMQTKFMYVHPTEWQIAIALPIARFEKRTANHVHAQSRKIIKKNGGKLY